LINSFPNKALNNPQSIWQLKTGENLSIIAKAVTVTQYHGKDRLYYR